MSASLPLGSLGLALTLISAVLHASWNLLLKGAPQRLIFTWWAVVVGLVFYSPLLLFGAPLPASVWPYAIASGVLEVAYFLALAYAYEHGEFAQVYPMARGLNPALLAILALVFLHEVPSPAGGAGLLLVLLGLGLVGWAPRGQRSLRGLGSAAAVALCSSVCSAIDAAAVRFAPPEAYTVLVMGLTALLTGPLLFLRHGRAAMVSAGREHRWRILAVGLLMILAYLLTLHAFSVAKASYVGAVREVSVVLGALAGWLWLGESFGLLRVAGSLLIFLGILAIALGG